MPNTVNEATDVKVQKRWLFHAVNDVLKQWIFKRRDRQQSQLESNEQDCSDIPIKSNRGSIYPEIGSAKGLVHLIMSNYCYCVFFFL